MTPESWTTFTSSRLPYRIRLPEGWSTEESSESDIDIFASAAGALFIKMQTDVVGVTPAEWLIAYEGFLAQEGLKIESSEPIVVAGMEARLYEIYERRFLQKQFRSLRAAFHDGTYGWHVTLTPSDRTRGEPERSLFTTVLTNFGPIAVLLAADDTSGNVWALQPGDCFASLPLHVPAEKKLGVVNLFLGGVDAFRRVACTEPHTGEVAAVLSDPSALGTLEEIFEAYVGEALVKSEFGILLMSLNAEQPTPHNMPPGVAGVFVIAHPAGPWSGSARGSGR